MTAREKINEGAPALIVLKQGDTLKDSTFKTERLILHTVA